MVYLMLDDLCRPVGEGLEPLLKFFILIAYLDGLPALCPADTLKGQAPLHCLIGAAVFTLDCISNYLIH